ncbi:MAG: hypothetical protein NTV79_11720, partial [Candidatus Aureabacteria bacterium]|nr:hypothetical protein [Candidatus Auribacterota bacterium]
MTRTVAIGALALLLCAVSLPARAENNFGVGGGVRYNVALQSLKNDDFKFDEDYLSYVLSMKYQFLSFLAAEVTGDYYPGSGDVDYTFRPSAAVLLGDFINVGVGITTPYLKPKSGSGEWGELYYQFQAGLQIPLSSALWINA